MKKNVALLFIVANILLVNCAFSQRIEKCELIDSVLSIQKISTHLQLANKPNRYIRLIDLTRYFKKCDCIYKTNPIIILDAIPLDFNTGRHIDIAITKAKKKKNILAISVFYTLSGQSDKYANLWAGEIEGEVSKIGFRITKSDFYNIQ